MSACADIRSLDPAAYIAAIGLQPEDSYGFLPVEHSDGSALVYVYRDRPEYEQRRAELPAPARSRLLGGMVEVDRPHGNLIGTPPASGGRIVTHRLYPGLRTRASTRQLSHHLPEYRELVGLRPEDVFGIFAQGIHFSGGESSAREWESMWIVYRDRPEYEAGRERYAAERRNWPAAQVAPGTGEPPAPAPDGGSIEVERTGWPRRRLVMHATAEGLAESLVTSVARLGYAPEDALGLCPDFQQRKVFFAWRKR